MPCARTASSSAPRAIPISPIRSKSPRILTELKLDVPTIATALLHDTIEDTDVTYEDVKRDFGEEIAGLVDGVTKLSQLELFSERTKQAENFRKLMLAMSNDHPRAPGQARRPAAQHAHVGLYHRRRKAPPHRPGNGRHLCPARRPHRHAEHARGAGRPRFRRAQSRGAQFYRHAPRPAQGHERRPGRAHRRPDQAQACRERYRRLGPWAGQATLVDLAQAQGQAAQFRAAVGHSRVSA